MTKLTIPESAFAPERADGVPAHTLQALKDFYCNGCEPGGFVTAVLDNDLREAFGRADEMNRRCLFPIVRFLYNHAPAGTWGFPGATNTWLEYFHSAEVESESENYER